MGAVIGGHTAGTAAQDRSSTPDAHQLPILRARENPAELARRHPRSPRAAGWPARRGAQRFWRYSLESARYEPTWKMAEKANRMPMHWPTLSL